MGAAIILFPKVKEETIAYSTSIEDLFEKEGHFYVYFNRKECPYCDNIEDDIKQFKKENAVYEIDAEACKGTRNYDWDSHEKKYDVEIGEKDSTRKIVFYDGLDENLIKEKYPPIHYKIIWANENYADKKISMYANRGYLFEKLLMWCNNQHSSTILCFKQCG